MISSDGKTRCDWGGDSAGPMRDYHDTEWGVPIHREQKLFELLCLEGAQAGLSWNTILNRRDGYRIAFENFDIDKIAEYDAAKAEALRGDERIIRNRAKIKAFIGNANAVLSLRDEGLSLDEYLWSFVDGKPIVNSWQSMSQVPPETEESNAMSKALKKRGFGFVGPTICYAFMQSAGMVNDHMASCFRYGEV